MHERMDGAEEQTNLEAERSQLGRQVRALKGQGEDASVLIARMGDIGDRLKALENV